MPAGSNIQNLIADGNLLYFTADDGVHGNELWRSDGTAEGTWIVKDITPGAAGTNISNLTVIGSQLFFVADDGIHGSELWVTAGWGRSTHLVADVNAQSLPFQPPPIATIAGTVTPLPLPILPPPPGSGPGTTQGSNPSALTVLNGKLYFAADDGIHGRELWVTDGSSAGTHMVVDLDPGTNVNFGTAAPNSSDPSQLTRVGNVIYFSANDGVHGNELWKTDGTAKGTVLVDDLHSNPSNLTAIGNTLYFTATDGGYTASVYKAAPDGVTLLKSTPASGVFPPYAVPNVTAVGNTLYFSFYDSTHGDELWKSDGSRAGTVLVKDVFPGSAPFGPNSSMPQGLTAVNGLLYFVADDGIHGREVWQRNGTAAGTVLVQDVAPGPASGADWSFEAVGLGNTVLFTANDGTHGVELWRTSSRT